MSGRLEDFDHYKRKRNEASEKLKKCKSKYYNEQFNVVNTSPKTVWKTASEVLGNIRTSFPSQILHGGHLLSNPSIIATEVNNYLIDEVKKLKEEFETNQEDESLTELKDYFAKKNVPEPGFSLKELNNDDIIKLLITIKGKKSLCKKMST